MKEFLPKDSMECFAGNIPILKSNETINAVAWIKMKIEVQSHPK
jgi:hypothetical protein